MMGPVLAVRGPCYLQVCVHVSRDDHHDARLDVGGRVSKRDFVQEMQVLRFWHPDVMTGKCCPCWFNAPTTQLKRRVMALKFINVACIHWTAPKGHSTYAGDALNEQIAGGCVWNCAERAHLE